MISVRLNKELEDELNLIAKKRQVSKSQIIKESLIHYFEFLKKQNPSKTPYELGKEFFGKYSSNKGNLSTTYKQKIKEKINAKNSYR